MQAGNAQHIEWLSQQIYNDIMRGRRHNVLYLQDIEGDWLRAIVEQARVLAHDGHIRPLCDATMAEVRALCNGRYKDQILATAKGIDAASIARSIETHLIAHFSRPSIGAFFDEDAILCVKMRQDNRDIAASVLRSLRIGSCDVDRFMDDGPDAYGTREKLRRLYRDFPLNFADDAAPAISVDQVISKTGSLIVEPYFHCRVGLQDLVSEIALNMREADDCQAYRSSVPGMLAVDRMEMRPLCGGPPIRLESKIGFPVDAIHSVSEVIGHPSVPRSKIVTPLEVALAGTRGPASLEEVKKKLNIWMFGCDPILSVNERQCILASGNKDRLEIAKMALRRGRHETLRFILLHIENLTELQLCASDFPENFSDELASVLDQAICFERASASFVAHYIDWMVSSHAYSRSWDRLLSLAKTKHVFESQQSIAESCFEKLVDRPDTQRALDFFRSTRLDINQPLSSGKTAAELLFEGYCDGERVTNHGYAFRNIKALILEEGSDYLNKPRLRNTLGACGFTGQSTMQKLDDFFLQKAVEQMKFKIENNKAVNTNL